VHVDGRGGEKLVVGVFGSQIGACICVRNGGRLSEHIAQLACTFYKCMREGTKNRRNKQLLKSKQCHSVVPPSQKVYHT